MDALTLFENSKTVNNAKSTVVVSAVCGRCLRFRSRRGAWLYDFNPAQFLCACCLESLDNLRLQEYARAESLIHDGGAA